LEKKAGGVHNPAPRHRCSRFRRPAKDVGRGTSHHWRSRKHRWWLRAVYSHHLKKRDEKKKMRVTQRTAGSTAGRACTTRGKKKTGQPKNPGGVLCGEKNQQTTPWEQRTKGQLSKGECGYSPKMGRELMHKTSINVKTADGQTSSDQGKKRVIHITAIRPHQIPGLGGGGVFWFSHCPLTSFRSKKKKTETPISIKNRKD